MQEAQPIEMATGILQGRKMLINKAILVSNFIFFFQSLSKYIQIKLAITHPANEKMRKYLISATVKISEKDLSIINPVKSLP